MKKFLAILMVLMLATVPTLASAVTLRMGSWRADDVAQMNELLALYKEKTGVEIVFEPVNPPEYNAALRLQLDAGTGPDLMYARSYETGRELSASGFFMDCSDIEGLKENFTASSLEPWQNEDGSAFAVPFAAVSHVMYYNKDIFAENGLEVPTTWDEFIAVCETLKAAGVTPLANGVGETWCILECFFLGMLPNYVGGAEQRAKYESGELKLNDEAFVQAYTDFASLTPYLPEGYEAVTYNDSQVLFGKGDAAMFMDGSWSISTYDGANLNWDSFAIPARDAADTRICFHPDMAITGNTATENPEEVTAFLTWLCSVEGATEASKVLPAGFFPMINATIEIEEPHANAMLALNEGKETDARFVWPAMMDLYAPLEVELVNLFNGTQTPEGAADAIAALWDK